MRTSGHPKLFALTILLTCLAPAWADDKATKELTEKDSLIGVWVAKSVERDGKSAPAEVVKSMRLTFQKDKVLIRGNFNSDREDEVPYKIDPKATPKTWDFAPPGETKPILPIYEIKGDELKVCLRHANSPGGRPTEFTTKPQSGQILMVFQKQKK